uniref:High-affinity nitrate transporter n=1 Tax=Kalanchoe fedtschenkoi TaxID=63787 RepID=A0A7N0VGP2_KALFE
MAAGSFSGFLAIFACVFSLSLVGSCHANVLFSTLPRSLVVTASPKNGEELKAGESNLTVTWGLNSTFPAGTDAAYKAVKVKLCYAPISQTDRAWRKTKDLISKDKTCQFKIVGKAYTSSGVLSANWVVEKSIPTGTYFVRAYAYDQEGNPVAYGQTTDAKKSSNLFQVEAVTGRHVSLDIASACFSGFSLFALLGFFYLEKRQSK